MGYFVCASKSILCILNCTSGLCCRSILANISETKTPKWTYSLPGCLISNQAGSSSCSNSVKQHLPHCIYFYVMDCREKVRQMDGMRAQRWLQVEVRVSGMGQKLRCGQSEGMEERTEVKCCWKRFPLWMLQVQVFQVKMHCSVMGCRCSTNWRQQRDRWYGGAHFDLLCLHCIKIILEKFDYNKVH